MKVGLVADAHGNVFGLAAALEQLELAGVHEILFAGDVVGYHPFVNETIAALRDSPARAVKGNHEAMLLGDIAADAERLAVYGLDHAQRVITADNLEWLRGLPESLQLTLDGVLFSVYHGSPWAPLTEYVYPDHEGFDRFQAMPPGIVVLGHTHRPLHHVVGGVTIVNPGSCGLPRDGVSGAAYAMVDTETGDIVQERVSYDDRMLDATLMNATETTPL